MRQSCLMFFTIISKQQSCKKLYYSDFGIFKIIFWNICIVKCEKNCWYIWWIFQSSRVVKNNIIFTWEYFLLIFWNIYIVKSEKKIVKICWYFLCLFLSSWVVKKAFISHFIQNAKSDLKTSSCKLLILIITALTIYIRLNARWISPAWNVMCGFHCVSINDSSSN